MNERQDTELRALQLGAGARGETADGRPVDFGDPAAEEATLREGVGIVDRGDLGRLLVTGADNGAFLQGLVTNDVKGLAVGSGCRSALLDVKGKVQAFFDVLSFDGALWLCLPATGVEGLATFLDGFLIMEDAELVPSSERTAFALVGPGSAACLARSGAVDDAAAAALVATAPATRHVSGEIGGATVELVPSEGGCLVWYERGSAAAVWSALTETGAKPVGAAAAEVARIDRGVPLAGRDADGNTLLPQVPMAGLVSWTKGCYLGQEPVARIRYRGRVNRLLTRLEIRGGTEPPADGTVLRAGDKDVGVVTSAVYSAARQVVVALGQVRRAYIEPGTSLEVGDDERSATVLGPVDASELERGDEGEAP